MPRCDPLAGGRCEISSRLGRRTHLSCACRFNYLRDSDFKDSFNLTGCWAGEATTPPSP